MEKNGVGKEKLISSLFHSGGSYYDIALRLQIKGKIDM